jgi:hypothetical protein
MERNKDYLLKFVKKKKKRTFNIIWEKKLKLIPKKVRKSIFSIAIKINIKVFRIPKHQVQVVIFEINLILIMFDY